VVLGVLGALAILQRNDDEDAGSGGGTIRGKARRKRIKIHGRGKGAIEQKDGFW